MSSFLSLRTHHGADSSLASARHFRVGGDLALVVADLGLGDGADGVIGFAFGGGVVGRQDGGDGADDRADLAVHLLGLRLVDERLQDGAPLGVGRGGGVGLGVRGHGDRGMLGEIGVVVRLWSLGVSLGASGQHCQRTWTLRGAFRWVSLEQQPWTALLGQLLQGARCCATRDHSVSQDGDR